MKYRSNLRICEKEIRKFIEEFKTIKDATRLTRVLSEQECSIEYLQISQGVWTTTSLKILLQTHFPGYTFDKKIQDILINVNNNLENSLDIINGTFQSEIGH